VKGIGADVVIVGGGVIGCALARELAGRGAGVTVVEKGEPGEEASFAAAGLLAPQAENLAPGPLLDLALESRGLYPGWTADLTQETGIDVGYRRCGILRCALPGDPRPGEREPFDEFAWQLSAGLPVERCGAGEIVSRSGGAASPEITEGLFFPEEGIVNNRLLTAALHVSARRRGVTFLTQTAALRVVSRGGRCAGVETGRGVIAAEKVVNAAGAWAGFDAGTAVPIEPVRGQIVEIESPGRLPTVLESRDVYIVPRGETLLLGSTAERVGFEKRVTAGAVERLIGSAARLVPSLAKAAFLGAWAGLRPASPDGLPILGPGPVSGLFLATGHFRNGILLAPVTSLVMADLISGDAARDLAAFSVFRFGAPARVSGGRA
jgi:glycine oxidase